MTLPPGGIGLCAAEVRHMLTEDSGWSAITGRHIYPSDKPCRFLRSPNGNTCLLTNVLPIDFIRLPLN
jgi:hypothetical protein